jgi:hypothetical protein
MNCQQDKDKMKPRTNKDKRKRRRLKWLRTWGLGWSIMRQPKTKKKKKTKKMWTKRGQKDAQILGKLNLSTYMFYIYCTHIYNGCMTHVTWVLHIWVSHQLWMCIIYVQDRRVQITQLQIVKRIRGLLGGK